MIGIGRSRSAPVSNANAIVFHGHSLISCITNAFVDFQVKPVNRWGEPVHRILLPVSIILLELLLKVNDRVESLRGASNVFCSVVYN